MNRLWLVARREYRSYFDHPTAYILVVAFLALSLFLAFRSLLAASVATMRGLFSLLPWLLAVFAPAITMRSLAEERRSGTMEWLLAHPVSELDVLLGKYLGNLLFVLTALAGTLPAVLGVWLISESDGGVVAAQYIGTLLLAAQFVAVGIFASSVTRNQITAFILGLAITFTLILIGLRVVTIGLPTPVADAVARLGVLDHFDGIVRGVVDLRDVLYFLTSAGAFLAVAYLLVVRERLSHARGAIKRLRLGTVLAVAGVVALNLLGSRIYGRLDLTEHNLYTLSDGTRRVLQGLDDVVTVRLVVSRELPPEVALTVRDVRDLLNDYRRASDGRFRVVEIDPESDPSAAEEAATLGIEPIQFQVMRGDEFQSKRGWLGLAMLYADTADAIPVIDRTDDLEYRLTSMISSLTDRTRHKIAFLNTYESVWTANHFQIRRILGEHYDVEVVDLEEKLEENGGLDPEEYRVIVMPPPPQVFPEEGVDAIMKYLDEGGTALILAEGANVDLQTFSLSPTSPMLNAFLEYYGVFFPGGVVFDLRSNVPIPDGPRERQVYIPYPYWPIVMPARDDILTRGLNAMFMGWPTSFEIRDTTRARPLWVTSNAAGVMNAGGTVAPSVPIPWTPEELKHHIVAVAIDAERQYPENTQDSAQYVPAARMIVVGDSEFLRDDFMAGNPQNLAFALNAIDWLASDESLISIRSKNRTPPPLVFESELQQAMLTWGNLVGVPLIFVLLGAGRVLLRRKISRRRWQEEVAA